jgi:hypothetical protein
VRCPRVTDGEEWQLEHGDRDERHQMITTHARMSMDIWLPSSMELVFLKFRRRYLKVLKKSKIKFWL